MIIRACQHYQFTSLNSYIEGLEPAITRIFVDSVQTDMDFRDSLSLLCPMKKL